MIFAAVYRPRLDISPSFDGKMMLKVAHKQKVCPTFFLPWLIVRNNCVLLSMLLVVRPFTSFRIPSSQGDDVYDFMSNMDREMYVDFCKELIDRTLVLLAAHAGHGIKHVVVQTDSAGGHGGGRGSGMLKSLQKINTYGRSVSSLVHTPYIARPPHTRFPLRLRLNPRDRLI